MGDAYVSGKFMILQVGRITVLAFTIALEAVIDQVESREKEAV